VRILSSLVSSIQAERPIEGTIHDIGDGGLSILIPQAVPVSDPVRCEIRLPDLPVSIPTLAQVRWVEAQSIGSTRVGLQFLI
jgi:c-di-GMP-binding flagellar brake protein YcgR